MITPTIKLVGYEDRNPDFIFVGVPNSVGRYLRTDKSVVLVICPHCNASIGEPCRRRNGDGYSATTHFMRRDIAQRTHRGIKVDDVLQVELTAEGMAT